jgi:type VI secretion system protein ImpC
VNVPDAPFTILALAPFAPLSRTARAVPVGTVGDALLALSPELWAPVSKERCPEGGVLLKPTRMRDFSPDGMVEAIPWLKALFEGSSLIDDASARGVSPVEIGGLLRELLPGLSLDLSYAPSPAPPREAHSAVDDILSMVAVPGGASAASKDAGPGAWKIEIEAILSGLLEEIFADEGFRALEAAWRGIETIVKHGPAGEGKGTRLVIASVSHETLPSVLDALADSLAQDPPNLVLVDLPLGNSPVHVETMERIARFAETQLAPAVVWLTPGFLNLDDWSALGGLPYLKNYIDDAAYAKWKNLRGLPEARWLAATCNRFLSRFPYGEELKARTVSFSERSLPWVSPVYALGTLAARSVRGFGVPCRLTDSENVRLDDCGLTSPESGRRASTETVIPLDRLRQFTEIGVSPLTGVLMKDVALMPLAKTVSGESLPLQMFFSCIVGFLIRLKDMPGPSAAVGEDVGAHVKEALALFFSRTGHSPPRDMAIDASETSVEVAVVLDISFTPPREMLPDSGKLSFRFTW